MSTPEGPSGGPFDNLNAIKAASEEAEGSLSANPPTPGVNNPGSSKSLQEEYRRQLDLNHEANRQMRWVAFIGIGMFVGFFLFILICTFVELVNQKMVLELLRNKEELNWHTLVFFSIMIAMFAAIPLSLAMALVKMISEKDHKSDDVELKMPTTELGRVILDLLRSVIAAAKPN